MAISREEFNSGRIDILTPIRQVLENYPGLALDAQRVRELLAQTRFRVASYEEVVLALNRLVDMGQAESKEIEGARWYTIATAASPRRLGFRQQE
jgi:hypothetical protein